MGGCNNEVLYIHFVQVVILSVCCVSVVKTALVTILMLPVSVTVVPMEECPSNCITLHMTGEGRGTHPLVDIASQWWNCILK